MPPELNRAEEVECGFNVGDFEINRQAAQFLLELGVLTEQMEIFLTLYTNMADAFTLLYDLDAIGCQNVGR